MERLFQLRSPVGFFRSTVAEKRVSEAEIAAKFDCRVEPILHFEGFGDRKCTSCWSTERKRVKPAVVGLLEGHLQDFGFALNTFVVARKQIAIELSSLFIGIENWEVITCNPGDLESISQLADLSKRWPTSFNGRLQKWPSTDIEEVRFTRTINVHETPSTFERVNSCNLCGRYFARLTGIETAAREEVVVDSEGTKEFVIRPWKERQPSEGLLVPKEMIGDLSAFTTDTGLLIVRENLKEHIQRHRLTNALFVEVGQIVN